MIESKTMQHLLELRSRLLKCFLATIVIFVGLYIFSQELFHTIALPLLQHLPHGNNLIATGIAAPFFVPLKLTFALSFFVAIPFVLYQLWAFIAPALYQGEKRLVWFTLLSSSLLFYLGMVFAYYVVLPLVFKFFIGLSPEGVSFMPDISQYLDFVLKLFFAFGAAFEVPVAIVILVSTGMTTIESLKQKRGYVVVVAFILGMLLTPPDVISQVMLAIPICVLFELGLFLSTLFSKQTSWDSTSCE